MIADVRPTSLSGSVPQLEVYLCHGELWQFTVKTVSGNSIHPGLPIEAAQTMLREPPPVSSYPCFFYDGEECRARRSGCVLHTSLADYQGCALRTTPELSVGCVSLHNGHFSVVLANGEQRVNTHREGTFAFNSDFTFHAYRTTCAQELRCS